MLVVEAAQAAVPPPAATTNGSGPADKTPAVSGGDMGGLFSRLKAILLAAASLVKPQQQQQQAAEGGAGAGARAAPHSSSSPADTADGLGGAHGPWDWDISQPLTSSYMSSRAPGWGAQRLCCNVAEALCCGLAASWQAGHGQQAYARALLLLPLELEGPSCSSNEALVISLAMGRLFVLLRGEEELARSMVPLLTDVCVLPQPAAAQVALGSIVRTLAGTWHVRVHRDLRSSVRTAALPGRWWWWRRGRTAAVHPNAACSLGTAGAGRWGGGRSWLDARRPCLTLVVHLKALHAPALRACAVMAAASVAAERSVTWAYEQICDTLLSLTREPQQQQQNAVGKLLAASTTGPAAGSLADAFTLLARCRCWVNAAALPVPMLLWSRLLTSSSTDGARLHVL